MKKSKRQKHDPIFDIRACARCGRDNVGDPLLDIPPEPLSPLVDGLCFCQEHDLQRELWEWGYAHQWPHIATGRYAVFEGRDMWLLNIGLASEDAIADLTSYVMALEEEEIA